MNIRLTLAMLVASLVFLGYFIISGTYKISTPDKQAIAVDPNQTPVELFYEYLDVVKEAKTAEELLPYHVAFAEGYIEDVYGSLDGFLKHEKRFFSLKDVKIISDNMRLRNPVKKLQYMAWHIPSGNRITGEVVIKKQNKRWVIVSHHNEARQRNM